MFTHKTVTVILDINTVCVQEKQQRQISEQCKERIMFINVSTVRMYISYGVISTEIIALL